jgi:hypothetical protein
MKPVRMTLAALAVVAATISLQHTASAATEYWTESLSNDSNFNLTLNETGLSSFTYTLYDDGSLSTPTAVSNAVSKVRALSSSSTSGTEIASGTTSGALSTVYSNLAANELYTIYAYGTPAAGSYSFNTGVVATPIPGAILLFGSGLLGLAGFGIARRRSEAAAA